MILLAADSNRDYLLEWNFKVLCNHKVDHADSSLL
jgi:hypothetical protein